MFLASGLRQTPSAPVAHSTLASGGWSSAGFYDQAEIINSRAAMIGLFALCALEGVRPNPALLQPAAPPHLLDVAAGTALALDGPDVRL